MLPLIVTCKFGLAAGLLPITRA